jgi:hypothetical protein
MMRKTSIAVVLAALAVGLLGISGASSSTAGVAQAAPRTFFGIVPQAVISEEDAEYMRAARIGSIRLPIGWDSIQPSRRGPWDWSGTDREIATAVNQGLTVLPFLAGVPGWAGHLGTRLPIDNGRLRAGWARFVRTVVERYGRGGEFWLEHPPGVLAEDGIRLNRWRPIHAWQIWNEANFFYFAFPVSPTRYARLLKISYRAVKAADPGSQVILSGLFGEPDQSGRYGMDADAFLESLYQVPGIQRFFDGVALHPYAFHVADLERMVEDMRAVVLRNHDPGAGLYITEMGWGSQFDPDVVAFEQGWHGQARELSDAYRYMLLNRHRLNLKAAYWFTWKDSRYYCNFCDSVGLFRESDRYRAKPAWRALIRITGGRPRP